MNKQPCFLWFLFMALFVLGLFFLMDVGYYNGLFNTNIDLNTPFVAVGNSEEFGGVNAECSGVQQSKQKRKRGGVQLNEKVYQGLMTSKGGCVKASGDVLKLRNESRARRPNVICRVETFGHICGSFDDLRKSWVREMGFGGLLNLVGMCLPRTLCYWLMTMIDPINQMLIVGEKKYRFSCNQVRWVLGIPKGQIPVPSSFKSEKLRTKILDFESKYGTVRSNGKVRRKGLSVTREIVEKLRCRFDEDDAEEFKMLFLFAALELVLCPTQCSRFPNDLLPALGCIGVARHYNWCALVLDKLMDSVSRFAKKFYEQGFAGGCGGCTLFLTIFYLDRLDRSALQWSIRPRVKVWTVEEISKACPADRFSEDGDFGSVGVLDVAYGERHPRDARDTDCLSDWDDV